MCNSTTFALRHTQISLSGILRHFRPPSRHLLSHTHDTNMEFLQISGPLLDIFLFFSKTKIFHSHPCVCVCVCRNCLATPWPTSRSRSQACGPKRTGRGKDSSPARQRAVVVRARDTSLTVEIVWLQHILCGMGPSHRAVATWKTAMGIYLSGTLVVLPVVP